MRLEIFDCNIEIKPPDGRHPPHPKALSENRRVGDLEKAHPVAASAHGVCHLHQHHCGHRCSDALFHHCIGVFAPVSLA